MNSRGNRHRSFVGGLVLLATLWLGWPGGPSCRAESPVHYFAQQKFVIPFSLTPERIFRQMHLHASTDGKNYTRVGSTEKRIGEFEYTARGEGWYYFVLQIEEQDGTFTPRNVQLV